MESVLYVGRDCGFAGWLKFAMLVLIVICDEGYVMGDCDAVNMRPVVLILGPTAGGKTDLALGLTEQLPGVGEIVSADSMQVYRGMDIGTAKPTMADRKRAVHHLIDIVEPTEPFTVEDWRLRAGRVIEEVRGRGRWPIVVGGTNLYIKVLLEGMFSGPGADEVFRGEMRVVESAELHRRLGAIDPESAARIHPNDRKRLVRALEVFHITGKKISDWQREWSDRRGAGDEGVNMDGREIMGGDGRLVRRNSVIIGLDWSVAEINRRINARVKLMMEMGFLEEVQRLYEADLLGMQAREALGYKQLICHLRGETGLEESVERVKIETRRFARKQRTWLRRFRCYPRSLWIAADEIDTDNVVLQALTVCLGDDVDTGGFV